MEKREKAFLVRVSAQEKERISKAAARLGLSFSAYVRTSSLEKAIKILEESD